MFIVEHNRLTSLYEQGSSPRISKRWLPHNSESKKVRLANKMVNPRRQSLMSDDSSWVVPPEKITKLYRRNWASVVWWIKSSLFYFSDSSFEISYSICRSTSAWTQYWGSILDLISTISDWSMLSTVCAFLKLTDSTVFFKYLACKY